MIEIKENIIPAYSKKKKELLSAIQNISAFQLVTFKQNIEEIKL